MLDGRAVQRVLGHGIIDAGDGHALRHVPVGGAEPDHRGGDFELAVGGQGDTHAGRRLRGEHDFIGGCGAVFAHFHKRRGEEDAGAVVVDDGHFHRAGGQLVVILIGAPHRVLEEDRLRLFGRVVLRRVDGAEVAVQAGHNVVAHEGRARRHRAVGGAGDGVQHKVLMVAALLVGRRGRVAAVKVVGPFLASDHGAVVDLVVDGVRI